MEQQGYTRIIKLQILIHSCLILLLGLAVLVLVVWTGRDGRFVALQDSGPAGSRYSAFPHAVLCVGSPLGALLLAVAALCSLGVYRESEGLLGMGVVCLGVLVCGSAQGAAWRQARGMEVESAAKDIYDRLCHDFAVNQTAQVKEHLAAIHSAFSCCGRDLPTLHGQRLEEVTCSADMRAHKEDCLLAIGHFLHKHLDICWTLILATATIALSGLFLTSSLYFSVRLAESWNRKGKYTLAGCTDSM
ncbi:tetraspanin-32-like [Lepisosteus oculatus]|uniref:tetraspanin-32-like n=1 Tax=Lepisosteus oculatus TaxID=7918 RepID=UPI0035F519F6